MASSQAVNSAAIVQRRERLMESPSVPELPLFGFLAAKPLGGMAQTVPEGAGRLFGFRLTGNIDNRVTGISLFLYDRQSRIVFLDRNGGALRAVMLSL